MKKFNYQSVKKEVERLLLLEQILINDNRIKDLIRMDALKRKRAYERIYDIIKNNIIELEDKNYKKLY